MELVNCRNCQKPMRLAPNRVGKQWFCSKTCRQEYTEKTSPANHFVCEECGKTFKTYEKVQRFCSLNCKRQNSERSKKVCPVCGCTFRVKPSHYAKKTYCSKKCMGEHYKIRLKGEQNPNYSGAGKKACKQCGKEFTSYFARDFCSVACYYRSEQKREDARRANDKTRKPAPHCKKCNAAIPKGRRMCDRCRPQPKTPGKCLHCSGPSGSDRDVLFCADCRTAGFHKRIPTSICHECGAVVYKANRKYCDWCWREQVSARRNTPRKVDANQAEIVDALKSIGCLIADMSAVGRGFPDLLVSFRGKLLLLEVKNPKARGKLNKLQQEWHEQWRGQAAVVYSIEEALQVVTANEPDRLDLLNSVTEVTDSARLDLLRTIQLQDAEIQRLKAELYEARGG